LYDVVSSHKSPNPEKGLIQDSLRTHISMVLKRLPDKEATVLKMYFGLNTQQPMSLSEIGDHFEITRERVRQMKEKAIKKLRIKDSKEVLQTYLD
ncbi:MAG: sigma-70 family RNA polymerase sigma factor, partial [Polaribacter sp.]